MSVAALRVQGQVVINEISSVQSDRLLQKTSTGLKKLGNLPAWHELDFTVPGWWQAGPGPHGFGYTQGTNVQAAVQNLTPVLYVRRDFTLNAAQAGSGEQVQLLINYDDGFIAYLNGVEVARRNTGAVGSYGWHHQEAFNTHAAGVAETIDLGVGSGLLRNGANVLAIQVHNSQIGNGQLRCEATLQLGGASPQTLVASNDVWTWFPGTHEPSGGLYDAADFGGQYQPGPDWTQLNYDETGWVAAPGALGYDSAADYVPQLGTNLTAQMRNIAQSLYMRREFTITQQQFDALINTTLTVDFDDGYVLYLNGFEISRSNLPGAPGTFVSYSQPASGHGASRDNGGNNPALIVNVAVPRSMLRVGKNVISGQLHNDAINSSDVLLDVRFSALSGSNTLTWVTTGSSWKYRLGLTEFAIPAPASAAPPAPEFLDWIELKNNGATPADLSGWRITDDADEPAKWTFPPGTTIPAGGYLVLACSGRDVTTPVTAGGMLHTNFALNSEGEILLLSDASGAVQSQVSSVPDQNHFYTWGLDIGSGQYRFMAKGTPGAPNVVGVETDVCSEVNFDKATGFYTTPPVVALSTATPNATIRYTLDGSEPTSTSTLYTTPFDPTAPQPGPGPGTGLILREYFQFGAFTPPASLPPGATPNISQLMTLFETPTNCGETYTHRMRGFLHPPQTGNYQFWLATDDDGELWLSTTTLPANKVRIAYIQSNWASPREWTKHATQQSVTIPLVAGQKYYIEALQSEGGGGDNLAVGWSGPGLPAGINVIEGRYLSPPATLPPGTILPPGAGVVRARAFAPGRLPSETRTRNYVTGVDPRLTTVPAFFLTGPASEAFYSPDGIFSQVGGGWPSGSWQPNDVRFDYNFCVADGDAFERKVALEIINPGNVVLERTNVGVRFAGSPWSRPQYQLQNVATSQWNTGAHNKPQVNMYFRGDFGISKLRLNGFFPTSSLNEWDNIRLRAGKNDPYNPFNIDEWMRRSFAAMGAPAPQGTIATLFINGQFKSYFNPCERPREPFFQEFYGSGSEWDVNYIGSWENGDGVAHGQMISFFRNNEFTVLANYQTGAAYWDMTNVADYAIINGWGATQDWPHNNYAYARERAPGAKWVWSMWDAEGGLGMFGQSNTHNSFINELHITSASAISSEGTTAALVFRRAHQSPEFRMLFADRLQKHFFNGGCMAPANRNARWSALRAQVEPLVQACFGGGYNNGHWDNWLSRDTVFFQQARDAGLWPVTTAPSAAPFGGTMGPGGTVSLSQSNGAGFTIYYTTNGNDPRAVGGAIQGTAYAGPIPVNAAFTLKARVRNNTTGEWSPIIEPGYVPPPPQLALTEIHYNPPGPDDLTEFLEITNIGGQPASLNQAYFTDGVEFEFGDVTLGAGESLVLVKDAAAFATAYPGVPIAGVFGGALDNSGEKIELRDLANNILFSVTYKDSSDPAWPADADGEGRSLVRKRQFSTTMNPNFPTSWRVSDGDGGSPGVADSIPFTGVALADLDGDGFPALVEHALGTSDTDGSSLPEIQIRRDAQGRAVISVPHPIAADDVLVDATESDTPTGGTAAILIGTTGYSTGWMETSWRSAAAGEKKMMRIKVTKLP